MRNKTIRFSTLMFCLLSLAVVAAGCGGSNASIISPTATAVPPTATNVPPAATSIPAPSTTLPPAATSEPADTAPAPVTLADNGKTITVRVGQRFLLNLGSENNWDVQIADQNIVSRVVNITVIRSAQGLYEAHAAGETKLTASGTPNCDSTQAGCSQIAQQFEIQIIVQAADAAVPPMAVPTVIATALPTTSSPAYVPYLDDRSDAAVLINSLYSAINQHQYARAYSYWEDTPQRLSFDQFQAGYRDTASVQVTLGLMSGGVGAGQLYWSVPVTIVAQTTTGSAQTFVGCYILHLGQPAAQGALPFQPLGIQSANIQAVTDKDNAAELLARACAEMEQQGSPLPLPPASDPNDISAQQYIDNHSDPGAVLRSMFNAINRHEYVRAYSYWKSTAQNLPSLDQFTRGYSTTQVVTATFGLVTPDAGAGQIYYTVPVTLFAQQIDGARQTFVGCYVLHIGNPDMQAEPPFQPLGIESANVKPVANGSDSTSLMAQACSLP